jgi:adenosine kinase
MSTVVDGTYTAQAFITTDLDDNQITAFHPGAMDHAHRNQIEDAQGVTSAWSRRTGDRHARTRHPVRRGRHPFIFDPGQGLPMFGGEELLDFIAKATYVCVNDYESQLICDRTGLSPHEIAERVEALIVTRGGKGSEIYLPNKRIDIPAATAREVVDPTGCGDAYRAGLLYGLMNGWTGRSPAASPR